MDVGAESAALALCKGAGTPSLMLVGTSNVDKAPICLAGAEV